MSRQGPGHERSALILYGTETGNAQEVAEELGALTERLRFATHVSELNQSKPVSITSRTFCSSLPPPQDLWLICNLSVSLGGTFLVHAHHLRGVDDWTR